MNEQENIRAQMRKGLLEYFVLLMLQRGRSYPSDLIEKLKSANMIVVEGTLYTLLNRLKREEKLCYDWEESPKGPPRKYYSLTEKGEESLLMLSKAWEEIVNSVEMIKNNN